jgi:enolase
MSLTEIVNVHARQVIDSRGNPTVESEVTLAGGAVGSAIVPSGASTGEHEAWELRDGVKDRYLGKGVTKAVANVNKTIAKAIEGFDATEQVAIDRAMIALDGTKNKAKLGANAILAVSLATAKLLRRSSAYRSSNTSADRTPKSSPVPMMNIVNGGAHSDAPVDFQEFMIMPKGVDSFSEALRAGCEIFHALKSVLKGRGLSTAVGDEGGFAPNFESADDALESIAAAVKKAGYKFGKEIFIALDVASLGILRQGEEPIRLQEIRRIEAQRLRARRPTIRISQRSSRSSRSKTAAPENDWDGWKKLTEAMGATTQLVGDDLFVTNVEFLQKGIDTGTANSILVKVNQIGSLTETLDAIELAKEHSYTAVISHRSGESEDNTIADIAVATNAGQIKTGSLSRTDRVAKYNQLLRIEEMLGDNAVYGGKMR